MSIEFFQRQSQKPRGVDFSVHLSFGILNKVILEEIWNVDDKGITDLEAVGKTDPVSADLICSSGFTGETFHKDVQNDLPVCRNKVFFKVRQAIIEGSGVPNIFNKSKKVIIRGFYTGE